MSDVVMVLRNIHVASRSRVLGFLQTAKILRTASNKVHSFFTPFRNIPGDSWVQNSLSSCKFDAIQFQINAPLANNSSLSTLILSPWGDEAMYVGSRQSSPTTWCGGQNGDKSIMWPRLRIPAESCEMPYCSCRFLTKSLYLYRSSDSLSQNLQPDFYWILFQRGSNFRFLELEYVTKHVTTLLKQLRIEVSIAAE